MAIIQLLVTDAAGNSVASTFTLIWDQTNPTGSWINPYSGQVVYGVVSLGVNTVDSHSGVASITYQYQRNDGVDSFHTITSTWDTAGLALDFYTLRMVLVDNAGNSVTQSKEVEVTRIVRQNGVSIYKINEETRTRQQVLELLSAAKLDPDGHNIVLQGDIVSLAEMKSVERRQVIEEIAGISMYEEKKEKCLSELGKVDAKLNEAEIILTEREVNLRELKKERDQAIKYKEIQESLKDHKATFLNLHIKEKQERVEETEKRKKEAEDKTEKINQEINSIKELIGKNKEEINKINNEIEVKSEKDQVVLRKYIEELKTEVVKAGSRLEVCQNEITKIKSRKDQLNNNIKEVEEKIKELKSKRQENEQELKKSNNEEKDLEKQLMEFRGKNGIDTDINKSLEEADKAFDDIILKINKLNEEKQNIIRSKDQIVFKLNLVEERLKTLKESQKELDDLKNKKKKLKDVNEDLSKSLNEDSSYSLQLNKLRQEISQNIEELAKQRSKYSDGA